MELNVEIIREKKPNATLAIKYLGVVLHDHYQIKITQTPINTRQQNN